MCNYYCPTIYRFASTVATSVATDWSLQEGPFVNYEDEYEYELDEEVVIAPSTPAGPFGQITATGNKLALFFGTLAIILAVAVAAWFAWGKPNIRGKDVGYTVVSPELITITFDVAKPKDKTVECRLDALNSSYAQVGTRNVIIGPGDKFEQRFTVDINTTETAVTATVIDCKLAK